MYNLCCDLGLKKCLSNARIRLLEQNTKGLHFLMSKIITKAVKRKTNMEPQTYFSKLPESLMKRYQEQQSKNPIAQRGIADIEDLYSVRTIAH